jgi:hypothetical protein
VAQNLFAQQLCSATEQVVAAIYAGRKHLLRVALSRITFREVALADSVFLRNTHHPCELKVLTVNRLEQLA